MSSIIRKSEIIVLHLTKYSDSGMIVHAIDASAGRCGFFLRGVGKNKQVVFANFHGLSILDVVAMDNSKRELSYIREYSPTCNLDSLRSSPIKSSIALFLSEVLYRSLMENQMDNSLFHWLCGAIKTLNAAEGSIANFHLWFLVGLCSKMGFQPKNNFSDINRFFSITTECFCPGNTTSFSIDASFFNEELSIILHNMLTLPFDEAMKVKLSGKQRNAFAERILDYLSYHLGISIKAQSLSVLHDIFATFA